MKGEIYRKPSSTSNQRKKHFSQLTDDELFYLKLQVQSVTSKGQVSKHLAKKSNVDVPKQVIEQLLRTFEKENIIEYNIVENINNMISDERVLIRSKNTYEVDIKDWNTHSIKKAICNLCIVVSIVTGTYVTAYYNLANDVHSNVDMSRYEANLKIKSYH